MLKTSIKIVVPLIVAAGTTALALGAYQGEAARAHNEDGFFQAKAVPRDSGKAGNLPPGAMAGAMSGPAMGAGGAKGDEADEEESLERARQRRLATITNRVRLAKKDPSPLSKAAWKMLEQPIAMPFINDTSLDDILKYIREATSGPKSQASKAPGLQIYVDPVGLGEAEKSLQSTVSINLEGIRLKTTLQLILAQLDLDYYVRDGVLIITGIESISDQLEEALRELEAEEEEASQIKGVRTH